MKILILDRFAPPSSVGPALGRRAYRALLLGGSISVSACALACSDKSSVDAVGGRGANDAGAVVSTGSGGSAKDAGIRNGGAAGSTAGGSTPEADASLGANAEAGSADAGAFTVSSPAFANNPGCGPDDRDACALFPLDNTGLGQAANVSPEIDWTSGPDGTQSYAIALHDLTYLQNGDPYTHWVLWNIPARVSQLPAELPAGRNPGVPAADTEQVSFRDDSAYAGSGACGNVYEFELYALRTASFTPSDANSPDVSPDDVEAALQSSSDVLDTATMRARSNPDGPCDAQ